MRRSGVEKMAVALSALTVNGRTVTIADTMSITLPSTADFTALTIVPTSAGNYITIGTTTKASGQSFTVSVTSGTAFNVVVQDAASEPTDTKTYSLTITKGSYDELLESNMTTIKNMGWFAAREFSGDLDSYAAGGIAIPMGSFKPKYVINIQITGGYWGEWDFANGKLKVYKAVGTEATKADLTSATFRMILME
jgi:hypothetical protein